MERTNARATPPIAETAADKEEVLARSPLIGLPLDARQAFLDMGTLERLPRRLAVIRQGEPTRSLLIIGSGRVKVERQRGDRTVALGHRGPGHLLGETALAGAPAATESATVVDDVEALAVPMGPLRQRLAADPPLRAAMASAIAEQHREQERRLMGLLLHSVEARLAAFLIDAASRWGKAHADGDLVTAPFTHAELALLIGSTRETVTLVLGKLKREGIIGFDRRRVVIRNRAELLARAAATAP